jgi:hypothetical protein
VIGLLGVVLELVVVELDFVFVVSVSHLFRQASRLKDVKSSHFLVPSDAGSNCLEGLLPTGAVSK